MNQDHIHIVLSSKALKIKLSELQTEFNENVKIEISKDKLIFRSDLNEVEITCHTIDRSNLITQNEDYPVDKLDKLLQVLRYVEEQPITIYFNNWLHIEFMI